MFLEEREVTPLPYFTPKKWQTLLLRNYGIVSAKRIASVLRTDEETVEREAERLGISEIVYDPKWKKYGYINIIKNNWHLVPYSQLMELLDMTAEELDYCLKEDDFLGVKLGKFKSKLETVVYEPLTESEIAETERIAKLIRSEFLSDYAKPFDFYGYARMDGSSSQNNKGDFDNIVYSYSMLYGDTLLDGEEIVSDEHLAALEAVGVNGLWIQGVLSKLSPYPFVEGLDEGYEIRRENLKKLIDKCAGYGIGIYLYLNEPRGVSAEQLTPMTEAIKGTFDDCTWSLCTETQPVKDYLYEAVKDLVTAVPTLKGIITITMSENMTNCHSRGNNICPFCKDKKHQDVVPWVNNIIQKAIDDAGAKTRLLANLWGWDKGYGWSMEDIFEGIDRMDRKIEILPISERGTVLANGKSYAVNEYSISRVGPCEESKKIIEYAKMRGRKAMAKVQINNTWEMAVVPYIPVFDLVIEHMENLKRLGVDGIMASWTLGGYPTVSLDLAQKVFSNDFDYGVWLCEHFGDRAKDVMEASEHFSAGFRHYPFSVGTIYRGVHELGPSNLMYESATGYKATMVTFAFDDYNTWRGRAAETNEGFLSLLDSLIGEWEKGLLILAGLDGNDKFKEFCGFANVVYVNIKSMAVQMRYNIARDEGRIADAREHLSEEKELARKLYALASQDSRIGYEASNHYYFTQNNFLEKFVNIDFIERAFDKKIKGV